MIKLALSFIKPLTDEEVLHYEAPETFCHSVNITDSLIPQQYPISCNESIPDSNCAVCMSPLENDVIRIKSCAHFFHKSCIVESIKFKPNCPICRCIIRKPQGMCPSGSMIITEIDQLCPGFGKSTKVIKIEYSIPQGFQRSYHENPGQPYTATNRIAYLPKNHEGASLLQRIKYAWLHGMTFTIGTSQTTGKSNVVVWGSIHHKTGLRGESHGFPDLGFVGRCNEELSALGVPLTVAPTKVMFPEVLHYKAPTTLSQDISQYVESITNWYKDECSICLAPLMEKPSFQIRECGHYFHQCCLRKCLNRQPKCPCCRIRIGRPQGKSPSGTMSIRVIKEECPGYFSKSFEIMYDIPSGIQRIYHENPGQPYSSTQRLAYLPNNSEGRALLRRLKYAWQHGLTFSVGRSMSTGKSDSVVWASIEHRTSLHGGPFGFPDPLYIGKCNMMLDSLGAPKARDCP
jgi:deltex